MDNRLGKYCVSLGAPERINSWRGFEKEAYKKVLRYKNAHWKPSASHGFARKTNVTFAQSASLQSRIRDALAYSLRDSPWLVSLNLGVLRDKK